MAPITQISPSFVYLLSNNYSGDIYIALSLILVGIVLNSYNSFIHPKIQSFT